MANIKVAVRVRPISEREIHLTGSEIVVHTEHKTVSLTNLKVSSNKAGDSRERTRRYGFDYCFDSSDPSSENYASQEKIYETLGETILDALFKRYNSCLVAYGQSASGKTYTMMGSKEDPGLTPRVCEGLFLRLADEEKSSGSFHVSVSYLEVYNERVRDLLRPSSNCVGLRVREHPRLGPYVQGLTHHAVPTLGSLISRVEEGTRARKTASTLQNPSSSRSHALLTLSLLPTSENSGQSSTVSAATSSSVPRRSDFPRGSKLHLVDLAGSESAAACGGINRLKEGANINKSLVALGNVISALADRGLARSSPGRRFIPYRDSALTWLLKDVLGGNATTVMLATISPASGSYNETSHTLRFAQRAQSVINRPVINEDPVSRIIRELRAEVARLKSLLLEKNVSPDVDSKSTCYGDQEPETGGAEASECRAIDSTKSEEEGKEPIEAEHSLIPWRRFSASEGLLSEKRSASLFRRFSSLENVQESSSSSSTPSSSSRIPEARKYNEAEVRSEVFVSDQVDEPVFVDIPTLVAVLIKPDENIRVDSQHQIEEICSDVVLEDAIGSEFRESIEEASPKSENSASGQIDGSRSEILERSSPEAASPVDLPASSCEASLDASNHHQRVRTKLRKQDSIDGDLSSRRTVNLQSLKKYGSIESLSRKSEVVCPIERSQTNLERRNGSSEKIKKLNNIKEVEDHTLSKASGSWKNLGAWSPKDLSQKGSNDCDKSVKDLGGKVRNQTRKQSIEGLKRKTSKDSSSSSSKDELVAPPRERSSRKGSLDQDQIPTKVHTPIQRARRAEIVAAVTERLYSSRKISEDSNTATTCTTASTPASEGRSPENTDVKLATATRMRLQEISRKMLAKRRRISVDTQTENQQTVRVKDTASLTEEKKIVSKDAAILTDRHEDYETLPPTNVAVLRVKETSTYTDSSPEPVIRCKDAGVVTDHFYPVYSAICSSRNDSGVLSDVADYSASNLSSAEISDLGVNLDRRSVESVDCSTNTRTASAPSNSESQTLRDDLIEHGCRCRESRCCGGTKHCVSGHAEKNVISISLPDMVSITIESTSGLESKIKVFDAGENLDERASISFKDNEAQTESRDALEIGTSTDDHFGQMSFNDFSSPAKPTAAQTDGKPFRIENIFHETGGAARSNPRIEIVADSSRTESSKNSLIVTNSVGTFFVPDTRENATGMDRSRNCGFAERFGASGRSIAADSFGKNTWPGQWRSRLGSRRKSGHESSLDCHRSLSDIPIGQFFCGHDCPDSRKGTDFGFQDFRLRNDLSEQNQTGNCRIKICDNGESLTGLKSVSLDPNPAHIAGLEQDTNFSDDSLDPMEDVNKNCLENSNLGVKDNPDACEGTESKISEKACPPDVVAHTKKEINESLTPGKNLVGSEDFDESQQIVFPKIKVDSSSATSFTTSLSDFKSLILGDSCCPGNQSDNFVDSGQDPEDFAGSGQDPEDVADSGHAKKFCLYGNRLEAPKSIIKKPFQWSPSPQASDQSSGSKNQGSGLKKVHFAVPEVFELTSSDSEVCEKMTSDEESPDGGSRSILEEYLDEAVVFMRNMNSMNEYMSAACGSERRGATDRSRRRGRAKCSSNYIEYEGRRVDLDEASDQEGNSDDEDLSFNVESYEKCLRSMDRLEECLARVKRHDDLLRDTYGIQVGGSTGAKLGLAKSSVDSRDSIGEDKSEDPRTSRKSMTRNVSAFNERDDGDNNNLSHRGNTAKCPGDEDGGLGILKNCRTRGFSRFSDVRIKDPVTYSQFRGRFGGFTADRQSKKREDTLGSSAKVVASKLDASSSNSDAECLQNSGCCPNLPKTKNIIRNLSEGIKSSNSRPRFSLSKYDSSNESSSSNEALESFMESIDNATRSRDKVKYPGSPRSKFLQLLSERRRIVENTRNGVS